MRDILLNLHAYYPAILASLHLVDPTRNALYFLADFPSARACLDTLKVLIPLEDAYQNQTNVNLILVDLVQDVMQIEYQLVTVLSILLEILIKVVHVSCLKISVSFFYIHYSLVKENLCNY